MHPSELIAMPDYAERFLKGQRCCDLRPVPAPGKLGRSNLGREKSRLCSTSKHWAGFQPYARISKRKVLCLYSIIFIEQPSTAPFLN